MINELKIELVNKSVKLLTGETGDKLMVLDEIRTLTDQIELLEMGGDDYFLNNPNEYFAFLKLCKLIEKRRNKKE